MPHTPLFSTHLAPGRRRIFSLIVAAIAALALLPAAAAQADTSNTLTIVGTSDVNDSGLIPNLIGPAFKEAYPQFAFKYIGNSSATAVANAETGNDGPSVLIVHAASLENTFVSGGYSYNNQDGNAIFRNDFVLAGPAAPGADAAAADVSATGATNGTHNIVQAFIDIATAGINGGGTPKATFISRGGAPGTVVAEHGIWSLVDQSGDAPAGLLLCDVTASGQGGGMAPIATGQGVTASGQPCPNGGVNPPETQVPDWYVVTGLSQGPNVVYANACTGGAGSPILSAANTCYVFTDRGTYDYLQSGTDPNEAVENTFFTIPNLGLLTYQNSASAPGGANELINYFHAYIINPSAPCGGCETVNLTAAQDFIKFVTSPGLQSQLQNYLAFNTGDSLGPPFVADASPNITATGIPSTDPAGKAVTVTGTVTNAELGYPNPTGETVAVDEVVGGIAQAIPGATAVVPASSDAYSITFTPPASGSYEVSTGQISQVENSTLSPVYGDILSPGASTPVPVAVQASATITSAKASPGGVTVSGTVAPAALDVNGRITILARKQGSTGAYSEIAGGAVAQGQSAFALSGSLGAGSWQVEASYTDPGQVAGATSAASTVTVPASPPPHSVSFKKATAKNGKVTVTGTLKPGPTASGAKVELLAVSTGALGKTKTKKGVREAVRARVASAGLKQIAKTSVGVGKTSFTIKTKLKRGQHWVLQLEYVQSGQTSTYSKLSTLDVH